jgi:hypothetical protein
MLENLALAVDDRGGVPWLRRTFLLDSFHAHDSTPTERAKRYAQGLSWTAVAGKLGVGEGTVRRAAQSAAKNLSERANASALISTSV